MKNTIKLLFLGIFLFGITVTKAQLSTATGAASILSNTPNTNTNVGIGTTSPTNALTVQKVSGGSGVSGTDGTGGVRVKWSSGYGVALDAWDISEPRWGITRFSGNTPTVILEGKYSSKDAYFNSGGNVGIGTTTPTEKLQVTGGNISIRTDTNGTWGSLRLGSTNVSYLDAWAGLESDNEAIGTNVANLKFYTSYGSRSEKMRVTASGNVGIGTTSPNSKLDIYGNLKVGAATTGTVNAIEIIANIGTPFSGKLLYGTDNLGWKFAISKKSGSTITDQLTIQDNGNVGIGTTNPDEKLTVKGKIHAEEIKVDLAVPADYVFQKYYTGKSELKSDYTMLTLAEIESFTKENHHLPNVPSAKEVQQNGLSLGTMSNVLLQKVEELTLYAIEQDKKAALQQQELNRLKAENENYKSLAERLSAVETELKK
jgi:hypothetical protein